MTLTDEQAGLKRLMPQEWLDEFDRITEWKYGDVLYVPLMTRIAGAIREAYKLESRYAFDR